MIKRIFPVLLAMSLVSCSSQKVNITAPPPESQPNFLDLEINQLTSALVDEQRNLASIRKAKFEASVPESVRRQQNSLKTEIIIGFDRVIKKINSYNDIETTLKTIGTLAGWGKDSLYVMGRKPAQGVLVNLKLENEYLHNALQQIEAQVGSIVDVRLDPSFQTILLTYKSLY